MGARAAPDRDHRRRVSSFTLRDDLALTILPSTSRSTGYLYDDFSSGHDYDLVVNYARELGALLLELPKARKVFVTADGHLQIR